MANFFDEHFSGERALFKTHGAYIHNCVFDDGESPLKESSDLEVLKCTFGYKYPLWYCRKVTVIEGTFLPMSRAGVWYTHDASFEHCDFQAPKLFRKCVNLTLRDADFSDAQETLWWCDEVRVQDANIHNAPYFGMGSKKLAIDHVELKGNYAFDGCENIAVTNSVLITKDAFWNCKHVHVENCYIEGEYFGWNSEDVTLVNCEIHSHQGFCYMKNIKLVNCRVVDTDLAFEYCENIDADIVTKVDSVKNPISGRIRCAGVDELIFDDPAIDRNATEIIHG